MYRKMFFVCLFLVLIFSFTGCSTISDVISNEEDVKYEESDNINLVMSSVETLNPVVSKDVDTYHIDKLIYQSLFTLDSKLEPQNDLVSKYTISQSGKSIKITMNKSKFSDGSEVTSDDVIFSIDQFKKAGNKSVYYNNVSNIKSYTKTGRNSIKIVFSEEGGNLANLTFPILPSNKYNDTELQEKKKSFKPLGSGKYKVKKYTVDEQLVLTANDKYSGEKPENKLNISVYSSGTKVLNLFDGNLISFATFESAEKQKQISTKNLKTGEFSSNKLVYVGFNCSKKILKDVNVRKAIAYSINTEQILREMNYGKGIATDSLFFPEYLGIENKGDQYKFSKNDAESSLKDAGFKDIDKDGFYEDSKGKDFTITVLVGDNSLRKKAAKIIAEDLKNVGIKSKVIQSDNIKKSLKNGNYYINIGEMTFDDNYDISSFAGGSLDYTRFDFSDINKDIINTSKLTEIEELKNSVTNINDYITKNIPYYPMFYKTYSYVISDEFNQTPEPVFNNIYYGCEEWRSLYIIDENDAIDSE